MKTTKYIIILLFGLLALVQQSTGQISEGGIPHTFSLPRIPPPTGDFNLRPALKNPTPIVKIDTTGGDTDVITQSIIGEVFPVGASPATNGSWDVLENGDQIWRLKITSNAGVYMMLVFSDFYLPEGTSLFVYSEDRSQLIGAFTGRNNTPQGKLTTTPLKCNSLIMEYYKPRSITEQERLTVGSVGLITKDFTDIILKKYGDAEECMINAKCSQYENWCNQRRSIALIFGVSESTSIIYLTVGSLLTNEKRDGKPLLFTAMQGIDLNPANDAIEQTEIDALQNFLFIFNYQSADCDNPSTEPSMQYSLSGATLIASNPETDYALLQLNQKPPRDYNVFYNGWSNDKDDMTETGVSIHHPKADIKKISEWEKKISTNLKRWNVKWTQGSMSDGSFGAPLFNNSGYVVGQHRSHNGYPACDDKLRDRFGRFDKSWHDYGLKWGLNPSIGSAPSYIVRMSGDETCRENWYFAMANDLHTSANVEFWNSSIGTRQYDGVYNAQKSIVAEVVTIQASTSVTFEAGQKIILSPGFVAKATSKFLARIAQCERGCGNGFKKNGDENEVIFGENKPTSDKSVVKQNETMLDEVITVYPNTSQGVFTVEIKGNNDQQLSEVKVYDLLGKLIKVVSADAVKVSIDISEHPVGTYILQISTESDTVTKKILISRDN